MGMVCEDCGGIIRTYGDDYAYLKEYGKVCWSCRSEKRNKSKKKKAKLVWSGKGWRVK